MKIELPNIDRESLVKYSIVAILVVVAYFIIRKAVKSINSDNYIKSLNNEIEPNELSYPLNQYLAMADKLDESMSYIGTNDSAITATFQKLSTLSDVLQLIKAFGSRQYYYFWGMKTLPQWFALEMSDNELKKLNALLKSKGINFNF